MDAESSSVSSHDLRPFSDVRLAWTAGGDGVQAMDRLDLRG
jgi:hypothetical protein